MHTLTDLRNFMGGSYPRPDRLDPDLPLYRPLISTRASVRLGLDFCLAATPFTTSDQVRVTGVGPALQRDDVEVGERAPPTVIPDQRAVASADPGSSEKVSRMG
jgi:hypothetical protein